ncbi:MAG: D-alanyl-D-alanine carboxypeptidase family protein [Pseudomonadales bacterium]|jgi:D-alanyl-D-alanine carboxypeptidase (penicillin-binding protein 5/6)|nr:D-alanyl-D-alanine carboxypeptidase family protein [Pseudomonadales bacterium]
MIRLPSTSPVRTPAALALATLLLMQSMIAAAAPVLVPSPPRLAASSWILVDADTGAVIAEENASEQLPPASLTKMMTDYIAAAEIASGRISLDDEVPISERAWRTGGSKMFVRVGDRVRLEDLIRGIVIQSGNDASVAVAEYIAGSEDAFAELMNQQAQLLGMENTSFRNATGWPAEGHVSSARDLSILARRIVQDFPEHYAYYSEREFTYGEDFQTGEPITQRNRNDLLWLDQTVDGIKTGHTEEAGYCLVASAEREGMRLISVVMGTDSMRARAQESQTLLRYGFRFFETLEVYQGGEELERQPVWGGAREEVAVGLPEDLVLTMVRGRYDDLEATVTVEPWLTAPLAKGQQVGSLRVTLDDEVLHEGPLVVIEAVDEGGLMLRIWHALYLFFAKLFA